MIRLAAAMAAWLVPAAGLGADVDQRYVRLFQTAAPAVVLVIATDGTLTDQGSGFFVTADGAILTNQHVVGAADGRRRVRVLVRPKAGDALKRYPARVIASDPALDLALLRIDTPGFAPPAHLELADSDRVPVGTPTAAIGHPADGTAWSLTAGLIGARRDDRRPKIGQHMFQSNADLNPGGSGGPLLDLGGRVIGINVAVVRQGADGTVTTGLDFSIRSNVARRWLGRIGVNLPAPAALAEPVPETARLRPGTILTEGEIEKLADSLGADADRFFRRIEKVSAPR